ncbi:hypothetical protein AAFC00_006781 [Neodothiora populina]|uniref:AA1-like domain-containing protein n=1 Tax=Neodothiora populina TaxID=2781224 RepID=A0ABR3PB54_9PEZI
MRFSTIFAGALSLTAFASASPLTSRRISNVTVPANFYLVTTNQHTPLANSSALKNVSLTTLYDPNYQPDNFLRTIKPGFAFVPTFNISDGVLHCEMAGPHGVGDYEYNSTHVYSGSELTFRAEYQGHGDLSLKHGYLLAVNGTASSWTICESKGEPVVEYKGKAEGCTPTYIQAVAQAPY